jgi:hypothetical protein
MARNAFDRQKVKIKRLEERLTPLEIAQRLEVDQSLPFAIAPALRSGQRPVGYVRTDWSEDASYFTAGKGASRLLVAFAALQGRLSVAVSRFLQSLDDDTYDVVILRDSRDLHFTRGISGFPGFIDIARRLEAFAGESNYRQVVTFGSSLGGFPALRAGLLLRADRAISVAGVYPWHPARLVRKEPMVEAFDALCPCVSAGTTELVLAYAGRVEEDKRSVETVRKTFPRCIAIPIDTDRHNLLGFFQRAQVLPAFLQCLLADGDIAALCRDRLSQLTQAGNLAKDAPLPPTHSAKPRSKPATQHQGAWPLRAVRRLLAGWTRSL